MATWTHGKLLSRGYEENRQTALERTQMEKGPPKQRKVRSRVMVERKVVYMFTKAEWISFKTWFKDTINQGASWFDWTDPIDNTTKQARIKEGDISNAKPVKEDASLWELETILETWE